MSDSAAWNTWRRLKTLKTLEDVKKRMEMIWNDSILEAETFATDIVTNICRAYASCSCRCFKDCSLRLPSRAEERPVWPSARRGHRSLRKHLRPGIVNDFRKVVWTTTKRTPGWRKLLQYCKKSTICIYIYIYTYMCIYDHIYICIYR